MKNKLKQENDEHDKSEKKTVLKSFWWMRYQQCLVGKICGTGEFLSKNDGIMHIGGIDSENVNWD